MSRLFAFGLGFSAQTLAESLYILTASASSAMFTLRCSAIPSPFFAVSEGFVVGVPPRNNMRSARCSACFISCMAIRLMLAASLP